MHPNPKKPGTMVLIPGHTDFWAKKMIRDKEEDYTVLTGPIYYQVIAVIRNRASKHIKQNLKGLKGKKLPTVFVTLILPLPAVDDTSRQKSIQDLEG